MFQHNEYKYQLFAFPYNSFEDFLDLNQLIFVQQQQIVVVELNNQRHLLEEYNPRNNFKK